MERFPKAIRRQLEPSAKVAVQLVGLPAGEAESLASSKGFTFVPIQVPEGGGSVTLTADLRVGRIRGFVAEGIVKSVQVG